MKKLNKDLKRERRVILKAFCLFTTYSMYKYNASTIDEIVDGIIKDYYNNNTVRERQQTSIHITNLLNSGVLNICLFLNLITEQGPTSFNLTDKGKELATKYDILSNNASASQTEFESILDTVFDFVILGSDEDTIFQ